MTDQEKDKLIVEALGGCWHEWEFPTDNPNLAICRKCHTFPPRLNFATWEGFGWWWERFLKQKWARECIHDYLVTEYEWDEPDPWYVPFDFLGIKGRDFLAEWLEANEDKWKS